MPQPLLQDWKEQYIHENYSRALDGEGLVEQVSCPRTAAYVTRPPGTGGFQAELPKTEGLLFGQEGG